MAGTYVKFNDSFFDSMLNSAGVQRLCRSKAEQVLAIARATAPVDTGAYKAGLAVEAKRSAHRTVYRVVGHDKKTMLIESKTGNLVRALKAVR